jgi:lysophospholipase L1-like esterase
MANIELELSVSPQTVPNISTDNYYIFTLTGSSVTVKDDGIAVATLTTDGESSAQITPTTANITVEGAGSVFVRGYRIPDRGDAPGYEPPIPISDVEDLASELFALGSDVEEVTVTDTGGSSSGYASSTYFNTPGSDFSIGPVNYSAVGDYQHADDFNNEISIEFFTDAPTVELRVERSSSLAQIYVENRPVYEITDDLGFSFRIIRLTFENARTRNIRIKARRLGFAGIYTEGTNLYSTWQAGTANPKPTMLFMTDSYGTGFGSTYGRGFDYHIGNKLNVNTWTDPVNATGWSSGGGNIPATRAVRQGDFIKAPQYAVACLGYNDGGQSSATIRTAIANWHAAITASYPDIVPVIISPWTPNGLDRTTEASYMLLEAANLGITFINIADVMNSDNEAIYGSGDGTHPNVAGHEYLGNRIAELMIQAGVFPRVESGWADYADTTYTSGSPFALAANTDTLLPNNGAGGEKLYEPDGRKLYDTDNELITGVAGEQRGITINMKVTPGGANGYLEVWIDIGGAIGELYRRIVSFPKGSGVEREITISTNPAYTLDTWEANGGAIYVRSNVACDIHSIRYIISRPETL